MALNNDCAWLCNTCHNLFGLSVEESNTVDCVRETDENELLECPTKRFKKGEEPILCHCCLNLFDESYLKAVAEKVADKLHHDEYKQLESFQLCIELPPQMGILHNIARICLEGSLLQSSNSPALPNDQLSLSSSVANEISMAATSSSSSQIKTISPMIVKENLKVNLSKFIQKNIGFSYHTSNSPFKITLKLTHPESSEKCLAYMKQHLTSLSQWERKNVSITSSTAEQTLATLSFNRLKHSGLLPSFVPYSSLPDCAVVVNHASLYVAGRYNKYSRILSQTPWLIDGVRKSEKSVQEIICDPLETFVKSSSVRFSSSGREDIDVRMLGNGRPFLIEFVDPHCPQLSTVLCRRIENEINSETDLVAVNSLCVVSKTAQEVLKKGEQKKRKSYCALVWSKDTLDKSELESLSSIKDLVLHQKTPIRVLHRRSIATRERTVYSMHVEIKDPNHFYLYMVTQAGTYIKEFVHGDFGRTVPNLCSLLAKKVDILTLDVTDVGLDWPPC